MKVLTATQEQALKPGDLFHECTNCPEMIVVPAGSFMMGSEDSEQDGPQHRVTIAKQFAAAKYELTWAEWDACAARGTCNARVPRGASGRGQKPVIYVEWDEAKEYVAWLSKITGKTYRLLSEAEYEYAARAGTTTAYPWGDDITLNGTVMANCNGCGSKWDNRDTAPVGSFPPNRFGLYDMEGNVVAWTEDCYHKSYEGAPADGSAWIEGGNCSDARVIRGGSWGDLPDHLRSERRGGAFRNGDQSADRGFRVARTLDTR